MSSVKNPIASNRYVNVKKEKEKGKETGKRNMMSI